MTKIIVYGTSDELLEAVELLSDRGIEWELKRVGRPKGKKKR